MTRVLGIAAFGRSTVTLVEDGKLRELACEEWFTRRKDDAALPSLALASVLAASGLTLADIDHVVFAEKPVQKFIRVLGRIAQGFPGTIMGFPDAMLTWLGDRLWLKTALVNSLGLDPEKILFVERNASQLSSAILSSPFESAAILIVDGAGEWATTTMGTGSKKDGRLDVDVLAEVQHPQSLLFLLDALAHHLQIPHTGGLQWLSALGAHGAPTYLDAMRSFVRSEADGAFSLDQRFFAFVSGSPRFHKRALQLIGEPRAEGQVLNFGGADCSETQRFADLVRSAQEVCAEKAIDLVQAVHSRTGAQNLCLGGPLFVDAFILRRVLESSPFASTYVDRHLDDTAVAIGAALYATHLGCEIPVDASVRSLLRDRTGETPQESVPQGSKYEVTASDADSICALAADTLAEGKIVGWVQHQPESTLRPLGQRAILADPASAETIERLRLRVKLAEPWVPMSLLVLESQFEAWSKDDALVADHADLIRDGGLPLQLPESVRRSMAPGVVHADGSAVVHVVSPDSQPRLAGLIESFARSSGRPAALAATSFNRSGDPIVIRPDEAVDLLRRSEMDLLIWGDEVVTAFEREKEKTQQRRDSLRPVVS